MNKLKMIAVLLIPLLVVVQGPVLAGNFDATARYAWGENVGWIDLDPIHGGGVTVSDSALTGYAWGENIGWIRFDPAHGGVTNDGQGKLSGYAWGENIGWISFSCVNTNSCGAPAGVNYGVAIDPASGRFSGHAWGENIGWIKFDHTQTAHVARTVWRPGADPDSDGDGMPDAWETTHGLNPTHAADASGDPDGDGLSNLEEYRMGTNPHSVDNGPGRPVLSLPAGCLDTLEEITAAYASGAESAGHIRSAWQLSKSAAFDTLVLSAESHKFLTRLPVPAMILEPGVTYYARARFFQQNGASVRAWPWCAGQTFNTCATLADDADNDGIPDHQTPADLIPGQMCLGLPDGAKVCLEKGANVNAIENIRHLAADQIVDGANRPTAIPLGLFAFRAVLDDPDQSARVTIISPVPFPAGVGWAKYDRVQGWQEFSGYVSFNDDRTAVTLELRDGGFEDADGVKNGIVVDPSGPAVFPDKPSAGGGGGCFINTLGW